MNYTNEDLALIKKSTGETIFDVGKDERVYKRHINQDEAYQKLKKKQVQDDFFRDYQAQELGGFVFMKYNNLTTLTDDYGIEIQDVPKLVYLSSFLSYNSNILRINKTKAMTKKDMAVLVGLSRNSFSKFYNNLIEKEIFIEENGYIKINDKYFSKGEILTDKFKSKVYISSIRYLYENTNVRKHKYLGLAYQLISYVNKHTSILCNNPLETNFEALQPMTTREICDALGVSLEGTNAKNITRYKKALLDIYLIDGSPLFSFFRINDEDREVWVVNPKVISNHISYEDFNFVSTVFFSPRNNIYNNLMPGCELKRNDFEI